MGWRAGLEGVSAAWEVFEDIAQVCELVVEGEFFARVAAGLVDRQAPCVQSGELFDATIEVPVMREELVLERVSVSGNTPAPSANIGRSQEIRVPLSEEKVRLEKQPVVTEEVNVGKREVADVEKVSADVRHEELRVDPDPEIRKRSATGEELAEDVRRHG